MTEGASDPERIEAIVRGIVQGFALAFGACAPADVSVTETATAMATAHEPTYRPLTRPPQPDAIEAPRRLKHPRHLTYCCFFFSASRRSLSRSPLSTLARA